jgi:regulator of sigma D
MFLFDMLFGARKKEEKPAAAPVQAAARPSQAASAPGTSIHHDAELIVHLKADHGVLLKIFAGIQAAAQAGDYAQVQQRLDRFRTVLMDHLLKENVRLYVYLEHLLAGDETSHALIREFRHEMDAIGKAVVDFLAKYKTIATQPELTIAFPGELAAIGEVLVARIKREEETLYPMYTAPA